MATQNNVGQADPAGDADAPAGFDREAFDSSTASMTPCASVVTDPVIAVRGLTMFYGATQVLHGIDLEIWRGEVCAIVGPA